MLPFSLVAQDANNLPALPGHIAYIGTDQNVYTVRLADDQMTPLTTDASSSRVYRWPTWSTDGRLAYFATAQNGPQLITEVYVSRDGTTPGQSVYGGENEVFNYASWSPQNCPERENCRDLAVLLSSAEADNLIVELIRDQQAPTNETIGVGTPFYFSWSPDGSHMLWHRNNQQLEVYDVATNAITETLPIILGAFQAPGWSPVDDRLLFGTLNADGETTDLTIIGSTERQTLVSRLSGIAAFSWSPNGNYVAYTNREGPLLVIDTATGQVIARSPGSGILAFFWSPDSRQLAYVTLATPPSSFNVRMNSTGKVAAINYQDTTGAAWAVLDVVTGSDRRYGAFIPTEAMFYLLVYFDQFAQSHRVWSPDSRYLVYAETTPDDKAIISILDTSLPNSVPFSLADGVIGVWSFD
ncbi:MAG TPA: hypothetical protein VHO69_00575 [Phototrophicaceae bacterium]|nr:hypothetical protein [Phototrophicaceae bacterium]